MDGFRFSHLTRTLTAAVSRRRVLGGLLLGALGFLSPWADEAVAKNCKKIKNKAKRKKCLAKAKGCTAQCAGKSCGDDGCGGTCGVGCSLGQSCQGGTCVTLPCGAGGPCRVFVTSSEHNGGSLNGLTGADAICQTRAGEQDLPGIYKAWLSDSTDSPATRFVKSTGPYRLVTGITIANNWADLTDGALAAPLDRDEAGELVHGGAAWTNTKPNGTPDSPTEHCTEWTLIGGGAQATIGLTDLTTEVWTSAGPGQCSLTARLYCFQQSG